MSSEKVNQSKNMFRKAKYTADIISKYEIIVSCVHITRGKKRNTYKLRINEIKQLFKIYTEKLWLIF